MLVFWREKLVFLAVPKTGTTALEGALAPKAAAVFRDPPILKHTPIYRYKRFVLPLLQKAGDNDLETLAVVRHPVSWLGSWYRYRHRDDLVGHQNSTRGKTFDEFVEEYCRGKPEPFAGVGSQAKFVGDGEGSVDCDHLFRYEAQEPLYRFFEERLDMKLETKALNVSPSMELTLSPRVEEKLRRKKAAEFEVWEKARST